jgi:RND family efflux transporter MFP subunit
MNMRRTKLAVLLVIGCAGALCGCDKEQAKTAPPPPKVTVAKPIVQQVTDYGVYTGRFTAIEEVAIKARVNGYLDDIGFEDGHPVKKDQVLFVIDPRPFKVALESAEGSLAQIKARKVTAQADVNRFKDLVPKGAATQQDLDRAIGQLGEAEAGIQSAQAEVAKANLDLTYAKIISPLDGLTSKSSVSKGDLIAANGQQTLTTIVKLDPIWIYFDVDERAAQAYRSRANKARPDDVRDLNIKVDVGLASEEGYPHEGIIDFIDNKVDTATGTIRVRAEMKNADHVFRPGFFARIRVPLGAPYDAVLVADRAIGTQQETKYCLAVDDKGVAKFRPLKLGTLQPGGLRVIQAGLGKDERVIVNGMQRARPDQPVTAEPGEMPVRLPATKPASVASSQPAATQPAKSEK